MIELLRARRADWSDLPYSLRLGLYALALAVSLVLPVQARAQAIAMTFASADEMPVGAVAPPQATMHLELLGPDPFPGETVTAALIVELTDALGAYSATLDCDPALFEIGGPIVGGDSIEFSGPPFQNRTGCHVSLSAFQVFSLTGPTGAVSVAKIPLRALATATPGASSVLDLTPGAVTATSGSSLSTIAVDGAVSVATNCGNSVVDADEGCDDGDRSWSVGEACDGTCHWVACGDPDDSGATTATDALIVLRASVGAATCDACVCDLDSSGGEPTASDALRTLRHAVGAPVTLVCPACQ